MPEPSPALIDTIARAIRGYDAFPGMPAWWDISEEDRAYFEGQARAALAAMPQPVGYAGAWRCDEDFLLDVDMPHKTPEDAKNASDGYHVHCDLIVALVPVEDQ